MRVPVAIGERRIHERNVGVDETVWLSTKPLSMCPSAHEEDCRYWLTMTGPRHSDRELVCRLCGDNFVFTAGEQELQRVRGIERVPTRCSACRRRPPTLPVLPRVIRQA